MYIMWLHWRKQWQSNLWSIAKSRVSMNNYYGYWTFFSMWIWSPNEMGDEIEIKHLPSCRQCQSLLRPHTVWFGESLWPGTMEKIEEELNRCDLFLVVRFSFLFASFLQDWFKVGTSGVVYPAAILALLAAQTGIPIAEVNVETTRLTSDVTWVVFSLFLNILNNSLSFSFRRTGWWTHSKTFISQYYWCLMWTEVYWLAEGWGWGCEKILG